MRRFKWVTFLVILAFHILALEALLPANFSWRNLLVAFGLYVFTGLGITFGFHRLLTHRAFEAHPAVRFVAVLAGSLAFQGDPIEWVADHRVHHRYADTGRDKHNSRWGFAWSHLLWLFRDFRLSTLERRMRAQLSQDGLLRFFRYGYIPAQLLLALGLYFWGGWSLVVWGVFFRTVCMYHATWLVNSATHKWGYRLFETPDESRNNWWVALLAFGEGWHNTHHAHQSSPRHGLTWWEVDVTWGLIWFLSRLGLVRKLKPVPALDAGL